VTNLFDTHVHPLGHLLLGRVLIEGRRFARLDGECPRWAQPDAEACAVAKFFADNPCLAVHQFDGAFSTGRHTRAARVAQCLVDVHDLPRD
jgi:hypothetical protein